MKLEEEIVDLAFLDKAFSMSKLMDVHDDLTSIKKEMIEAKELAIDSGKISRAVELEKQLYFITSNINNVEIVMLSKESDLFEFEGFDLICKN